jgi:hypothetical protein
LHAFIAEQKKKSYQFNIRKRGIQEKLQKPFDLIQYRFEEKKLFHSTQNRVKSHEIIGHQKFGKFLKRLSTKMAETSDNLFCDSECKFFYFLLSL